MIPLTLAEVAQAVGGAPADVPDPQALVSGPVVVDSRAVEAGSLFVAVQGERVDGHDYAGAALAAGATAVLAQRPVGVPAVVVEDTERALGLLARAVLDRLPGTSVVGITGSSGKTSTKDLLASLIAGAGSTVAPAGSLNNELGVPLTVLRADEGTRFLVVEMGARGIGHIRYLCDVAPPRVGVVLNVGGAHASEFGSREGTAQAKGELVEALPAEGVAVLTADDDLVRGMAARTAARVVLVGTSPLAQVRAEDVELDAAARPRFRLVTPQGTADVALALHGEHQVLNALSATAAALELGVPLEDVVAELAQARPGSRWRMEVVERPDGVTVVNDAYNANPESVRAALKALAAMGRGRRTWAVLGEMRELGDSSAQEHDAIGRLAVRLNISRLVAVGPGALRIHAGAVHEGSWGVESVHVRDAGEAADLLAREVEPGDVVLVKASRAVGLERVAAGLLEQPAAGRVVP